MGNQNVFFIQQIFRNCKNNAHNLLNRWNRKTSIMLISSDFEKPIKESN